VDPDAPPVVEEKKAWLPNAREGEHVFGVAHIFASFNDTFVVRAPSRGTPHETSSYKP
jgi:ribosomal protein S11